MRRNKNKFNFKRPYKRTSIGIWVHIRVHSQLEIIQLVNIHRIIKLQQMFSKLLPRSHLMSKLTNKRKKNCLGSKHNTMSKKTRNYSISSSPTVSLFSVNSSKTLINSTRPANFWILSGIILRGCKTTISMHMIGSIQTLKNFWLLMMFSNLKLLLLLVVVNIDRVIIICYSKIQIRIKDHIKDLRITTWVHPKLALVILTSVLETCSNQVIIKLILSILRWMIQLLNLVSSRNPRIIETTKMIIIWLVHSTKKARLTSIPCCQLWGRMLRLYLVWKMLTIGFST